MNFLRNIKTKPRARMLLALGVMSVIGVGLLVLSNTAWAQQVSLGVPDNFAGFSSRDIRVTIANIVQIILGFLGVIFVLLLMYAGFLWMTSRGDDKKIQQAKKIIVAAVIGLLVILSAYAITVFIVRALQQAVGDGGTGTSYSGFAPPGGGSGGCTDPGPGQPKICSIGGLPFKGSVITLSGYHFGAYDPAVSKVLFRDGGGVTTEAPVVVCSGAPGWGDSRIKAIVPSTITGGFYTVLVETTNGSCDEASGNCSSSTVSDGIRPSIYCVNPSSAASDADASTDPVITVTGANFGTTQGRVTMQSATGRFNAPRFQSWAEDTIVYNFPDNPPDPIPAISGDVIVFDTGADGTPNTGDDLASNEDYFTVTCTSNSDCGSNCCVSSNICREINYCNSTGPGGPQAPVITNVTPNDGAQGNYITVQGRNFGNAPGVLHVWDSSAPTPVEFINPRPNNPQCTNWWSDTQIIFEVPAAAQDGATRIMVTNQLSLDSNNWTTFVINNTVRPGLCQANPSTGAFGDFFSVYGNNLANGQDVYFGDRSQATTWRSADNQSFAPPGQAAASVPSIQPGNSTVAVAANVQDADPANDIFSNPVNFTVLSESDTTPVITEVSPNSGPKGTYTTIIGRNFGSQRGTVFFIDTTGTRIPGDFTFPGICMNGIWSNDHIIVKNPTDVLGNNYLVVRRLDGTESYNGVTPRNQFAVNNAALQPGLCRIDPLSGPVATTKVDYFGDHFGTVSGATLYSPAEQSTVFQSWNNQQTLDSVVPNGAVTGFTRVRTSAGQISNPLPFTVGECTNDAQCSSMGGRCCDGVCRLSCAGTSVSDQNEWQFESGQVDFDLVRSPFCTEETQSPTPFPYAQSPILPADPQVDNSGPFDVNNPAHNAPVNSVIAARYTRSIKFNTVAGSVKVYQCAQGNSFAGPCADITGNGSFDALGSSGWQWIPNALLAEGTWYEIRMDTGLDANGLPISSLEAEDGSLYQGSQFLGNDPLLLEPGDFRWHFRTRNSGASQDRCEIDTVRLTPATSVTPPPGPLVAPVGGISGSMTATPQSKQCYICSGAYDYQWSKAPATGYVEYWPTPAPAATPGVIQGANLRSQRFSGLNITPANDPVDVVATILNTPRGPVSSAPGLVAVKYVPPYVVQHSPSSECRKACRNAAPFAVFNVSLQSSQAMIDQNANIYACTDSSCANRTLVPATKTFATIDSQPNRRVDIAPNGPLASGTWHVVIMRARGVTEGIRNTQDQLLDKLNFDIDGDGTLDSYAWKFQTSAEICDPDAIDVEPASAVMQTIGGKLGYAAYPTVNVGECGEMSLNAKNYSWEWRVNNFGGITYAEFDDADPVDPGPEPRQTVIARAQTPANPQLFVSASIPASAVTGQGLLQIIDNRDTFDVIGFDPDNGINGPCVMYDEAVAPVYPSAWHDYCTQTCRNILVSAEFSSHIDPASVGNKLRVIDLGSNTPVVGTSRVVNYTTESGERRGRIDFEPVASGPAASDYEAYYSFNDGTAQDASNNNHNGAFRSGARSVDPSSLQSLGRSVSFPTVLETPADYVLIPESNNLDIGSGDFTVSLWAKSRESSTWFNGYPQHRSVILSKGSYDLANNGTCLRDGYYIQQYANAYSFIVCDQGRAPVSVSSGSVPEGTGADTWHHYAWTFTASTGTVYSYLDGMWNTSAYGVSPVYAGKTVDSDEPLCIGGMCDDQSGTVSTNYAFHGEADEVRLYKRALSMGELQWLYRVALGEEAADPFFRPSTNFEARLCTEGSCADPILSKQGVAYTSGKKWAFKVPTRICKISYLDIVPNPARFTDRQRECATGTQTCLNFTPQPINAYAMSESGTKIGGFKYEWRQTSDVTGGTYSTEFYRLFQPAVGNNIYYAEISHKGKLGVDYNEVKASTGVTGYDLGSATASGRMEFSFCQNPWIGDQAGNQYYLDTTYDVKLRYCQDAPGSNPSDPDKMLPDLPTPHIIRTSQAFSNVKDLLKEHVFIVGSQRGSAASQNIAQGLPRFTGNPDVADEYEFGDLVYFRLPAEDPDGDSFVYTMADEADDRLPVSANFNPRTGVFMWVIDQLPANNDDANPFNDFQLNFGLNPTAPGEQRIVHINVKNQTAPTSVVRPGAMINSIVTPPGTTYNNAEGNTYPIKYGDTVTFNASMTCAAGQPSPCVKTFLWDFQDSGSTQYTDSTEPTYQSRHLFLQPGLHQVTFRVQDNRGVWSAPSTVNIQVSPKQASIPEVKKQSLLASVTNIRNVVRGWLTQTAQGQAGLKPPMDVKAESVGDPAYIRLTWTNQAAYEDITIYRRTDVNNEITLASGLAGTTVSYDDKNSIVVGTAYTYRICGSLNRVPQCTEVQVIARNVDFDVIVMRVYKNTDHLPIAAWYKKYAPNPTGKPANITVDGYQAIQDGTSVYVGVASCDVASACTGRIYTNVLLLSYNEGAQPSTLNIFSQLVDNISINDSLTRNDSGTPITTCSGDTSVHCEDNHDADCKAANAGWCMTGRAELRRDFARVVDLHVMRDVLVEYGRQHTFCADGSNTISCRTDADCPKQANGTPYKCAAAYPVLTSGTYVPGMSTSQWPSWTDTLGKELRTTLPKDPINKFGANFYSPTPETCSKYPGHDVTTCWNERTLQFKCQQGSSVYIYQSKNATNFSVLGQVEASNWALGWDGVDPRVVLNMGNAICKDTAISASCGNGIIEGNEKCDGGSTEYCDWRLGNGNWNNEFRVGCKADCSGWADPYNGNNAAAINACGGRCGNGTVESPSEQCDGTVPAGYSCTAGGTAFCSNVCQVDCTEGQPYVGSCGDGRVRLPEVCDDGPNNGQSGRCNVTCTGYTSFCGDGVLTPIKETSLGCRCDAGVSCTTGKPVAGQSCAMSCPTGTAHQWSCVQNVEECDGVIGLNTYSCPAATSLYCDGSCKRACTTIAVDSVGKRQTIPVYEHYYLQGSMEDYDYTITSKADDPYQTKSIVWYAYNPTGAATCGNDSLGNPLSPVYRFTSNNTSLNVDHYLTTNSADLRAGYSSVYVLEFCAYRTTPPTTSQYIVPVYEFRSSDRNPANPTYGVDYYYSRNNVPRSETSGKSYTITNGGSPAFYAWVGPFQESCGNGLVEGNETCEPASYQTPAPEQSSVGRQYMCGERSSTNACRTYGGYCGDGGKNEPYEQCDEGGFTCEGTNQACSADTDCAPGIRCGGRCGTVSTQRCTTNADCSGGATCRNGLCTTVTSKLCTWDGDPVCTGTEVCLGNGATCVNNSGNCTYCTRSCGTKLVPRNFCGDGIQNCGPETPNVCGDEGGLEEVCDDGVQNNGKPGKCNETCSGPTGAVCGDGKIKAVCDNNLNQACGYCGGSTANPACESDFQCTGIGNGRCLPVDSACGAGKCTGGERCDDGPNNGRWTRLCENDTNVTCMTDQDCVDKGVGGACSQTQSRPYCDYTCQKDTLPMCGDLVIQQYCSKSRALCGPSQPACPAGETCKLETCDQGSNNGTTAGSCNTTCDGFIASTCGNGTIEPGEQCDPPSTRVVTNCYDQSAGVNPVCEDGATACTRDTDCAGIGSGKCGRPGLQYSECSPTCQQWTTQCHAFGLKLWSDAADVAYINGQLLNGQFGTGGVVSGDAITHYPESMRIDSGALYLPTRTDSNSQWRIEKRSPVTGALDTGFTIPTTPAGTTADSMVAGNYLYVVGQAPAGSSGDIRIEKRNVSTGALCTGTTCSGYTFGTNGVITEGGYAHGAWSIDADSTYMYIGASNSDATGLGWRLEKRRLDNGNLCTSSTVCNAVFGGSDGILTGASEMISNLHQSTYITDVRLDGNYLFVAGRYEAPSGQGVHNWRIEKRRTDTGALCDGSANGCADPFAGTGFITSVTGNYLYGFDVDDTAIYAVGDNDAGQWRMEKYDKTTGSLLWAVDIPVTGNIGDINVQSYVANNYVYISGWDGTGGRIERRLASDGSLDTTWGTGNSGYVTTVASFNPKASALNGNYLYVTGNDAANNARTERRLTSTGELDTSTGGSASHLALLSQTATACVADPASNGADYSLVDSPSTGNSCLLDPVNTVPDQAWNQASDVRPIDSTGKSIASMWERVGNNTVAVKLWPRDANPGTLRSFLAVYASPSTNQLYDTNTRANSFWTCSNTYTLNWNQIDCPECSYANGWRVVTSYTNDNGNPLCAYNYDQNWGGNNPVGGEAKWVWGPACRTDGSPIYCRMSFEISQDTGYTDPTQYCGNGIKEGTEECDRGTGNRSTCTAAGQCATNCVICEDADIGRQPPCFLEGTLVKTPEGYRRIEEMKAGDVVMSYNIATGVEQESIVVERTARPSDGYYIINDQIKVTGNHPFAIQKNKSLEWIEVKDLQVGDMIYTDEGSFEIITSLVKSPMNQSVPVYNLVLPSEPHNYYVKLPAKSASILVHNICCDLGACQPYRDDPF